jgi:hypothetical protein
VPRYELDVRLFFFANQKPFLGLAIDSRTRRRITASCDELTAARIKLQGFYVGRMRPDDDPRLEPRMELLGRVSALEGCELQLDDAREGAASVKMRDLCANRSRNVLLLKSHGAHLKRGYHQEYRQGRTLPGDGGGPIKANMREVVN